VNPQRRGYQSSGWRIFETVMPAGGAYVPTLFVGMYAPLRCADAKEQHVC